MFVLLPPSEGKATPVSGDPLDLDTLSYPRLNTTREQLLRTLIRVSGTKRAAQTLGLGPTQAEALITNQQLLELPCAPAADVYTGVLFGELDLATLAPASRQLADRTLTVTSALFGLVNITDRIPAYRMSGAVSLPRLGPVASRWRPILPDVLQEAVGDGLLIDLRSGTYLQFGKPTALATCTATVRVLSEVDGVRKTVSHFNKATKGQLVRALLQAEAEPSTVDELASTWRDLGWTVEHEGTHLDVVLHDS